MDWHRASKSSLLIWADQGNNKALNDVRRRRLVTKFCANIPTTHWARRGFVRWKNNNNKEQANIEIQQNHPRSLRREEQEQEVHQQQQQQLSSGIDCVCVCLTDEQRRFRTCLCVTRCSSSSGKAGKSSSLASSVVTKRRPEFSLCVIVTRRSWALWGKFEEKEESLCSGREEGSLGDLREDGFNVCAGAVLARRGFFSRREMMSVLYYCFWGRGRRAVFKKLVSEGLKIRAYWEVREKLLRNCAMFSKCGKL